ncbi:hypothetical protein SAMN04487943_10169 [Gracilibacillus orientalis]|uniref:Uncharacterized protein n=1 Tax=Gracilibacillus orientalis TaxID=334253 RepID=A0A1I4GWA4_9BACI|nr:hypothetical protein [Gracilibacillus orientalis]SFL34245.1 hypothetical protein SAMN04487943_10169 [Gracilibacillus orientalis]
MMAILELVGLFAIIFSITYLSFHFIKKITNKERVLSKKIFYLSLLGGISLFVLAVIVDDSTVYAELDEVKTHNEEL